MNDYENDDDLIISDDSEIDNTCPSVLKTTVISSSALNDGLLKLNDYDDLMYQEKSCLGSEQMSLKYGNNNSYWKHRTVDKGKHDNKPEEYQLRNCEDTIHVPTCASPTKSNRQLSDSVNVESKSIDSSPVIPTHTKFEKSARMSDSLIVTDKMQEAISVLNDNALKITKE